MNESEVGQPADNNNHDDDENLSVNFLRCSICAEGVRMYGTRECLLEINSIFQ